MEQFEIYFSELDKETQEALLEFLGIEDYYEASKYKLDKTPLAILTKEDFNE